MVIGIDITFLKDQFSSRGIGVYGKSLVKELLKSHEHQWVLFGFDDFNSNLSLLNVKNFSNINFVSLGKTRNSSPLINWWLFKFNFLPKIKKAKLDLFFSPHFERGLPLKVTKTVVVMHDIIPFVTNKYSQRNYIFNYLKGIYYRRTLKNAVKADSIITDSDFSKRELVNKGGFDENKITRIYLGIKDEFRRSNITQDTRDIRRILTIYNITKPYILYYGGLEPNKNISVLLASFRNVIQRFPDLKLLLVGKEFKVGWDNKVIALTPVANNILQMVNANKLKHNVVFSGQIDNAHLPIVLNNSKLFVHLSTYEGFGLSVVEALAAGIPVITPRRSSNPEVFKDAVTYVPAKDAEKISHSIQQILDNESLIEDMIKKGINLTNKYNWEKTADETLKVFEKTEARFEKLKICYLISNFYPFTGGAENNCLAMATLMASSGHDVTVITSDMQNSSLPKFEVYKNIKIQRCKKLNKDYYLGFYPGAIIHLLTQKFNLIHVHGFGFIWLDFCLVIKKFLGGRKLLIVNTPHGPFMANRQYNFLQKISKMIFTNIQKIYLNWLYNIVFKVNPLQNKWIEKYGINKNKIQFLPNGINKKYFEPVEYQDVLTEYKLNKKYVISFIGRFEKYKGLQDILDILPEITAKHKNVVLVCMGNKGNYSEEISKIIETKKIENNVRILQSPTDLTIKKILSFSNIFILPSSWEAFGISILEAMANHNAIISTITEGGEYLIKEEENGYLYDFGDKNDLKDFINKIIEDKDLLNKFKKNNYLKAKSFVWENIILTYQKIIHKAIKK